MSIINTDKQWNDILPTPAIHALQEVIRRMKADQSAGAKSELVLLHGAVHENKKAAAALMGASLGMEAYRVDVSALVSKYIGETEKNLEAVFQKAAGKDWLLFFDEADALFGKRTDVKDSHDKYANEEISYLLQKIQQAKRPLLLAVRNKSIISPELLHHFPATIDFPTDFPR